MKKILLIIALLISALGLNAQSVIIDDLEFTVTSEPSAECKVSGYSGEPTDVTIPSTVTISGKGYSVTSIGYMAFWECSSLTSIEIPSGVTSIGINTFYRCSSLTSIVVESGNTVYDSRDNCNAIIETATNTLIAGCQSTVIPNTVTSIGDEAFSGCSLTSIEIPSGVTSIGESAFFGCFSLTSIEIPSGVTSIGDEAFSGCFSLTSIEIPSGVTSIGFNPFVYCPSLTSIVVESGNTVYDSRNNCNAIIETETNTLIAGCQNTVIPNTVTSIANYAFYICSSLTSIEIPSGVTSIGDFAFRECSSLTSIEIPSGVTSIGYEAFYGCSSLTSIIVESGNMVYDSRDNCNAIIETATNTLIAGCKNTVIPNSVTSIGSLAFWDCSSLTSIEIPSGVTYIGNYAFYGCSSLTSIYCYAESVPETGWDVFGDCPSDMVIYVPEQSVGAYKAASPWNEYTIMVMPYFVTVATNPEDAGIITGAGAYAINDTVTLTATANEGYKFINWTENDSVVSEVAEYTFVVESDRNLVANFEEIEQPTDSLVLSAPALAVDTVTETTVVLVWNAIDSATSYNVYMDSVLVKNVTDTIYTVDSLISDSTYNFMVTAVADTLESEFSNAVTVTTLKAEGEEPEQPENPEEPGDEPEEPIELDAPENVEATATSTSSIIITWDKVENALSYNIYRDGELLDDTENTNYTDKDLEYNTEYCYTIEAVNGKETSDESEEVCVKTLGEGVEELASSFNIYPNPVSDKLYIETQTQTQTVEIYDVYGRQQSMVNGQQSTVIDVTSLNSGIYFVKVVTSEGEAVKRFIKK